MSNIKDYFNTSITIKITWRLVAYVILMLFVFWLVTYSIFTTYGNNMVLSGAVWMAVVMSYLFSIFLIKRKEMIE